MTTPTPNCGFSIAAGVAALSACLAMAGCGQQGPRSPGPVSRPSSTNYDSLAVALAPHAGEGRLDASIRQCQLQARAVANLNPVLEQLGWLFVAKARESFDAGFYTLAEHCALSIELSKPGSPEALLLRGHALHSLHRFSEAERLARQLSALRGLAFDYGLLGDILVDVGRVDEAVQAYQRMLDLKPDPQGYARAAHIRWLKGDLDGALEIMELAARSASPRDPESAAWMLSRWAGYLAQAGQSNAAGSTLQIALSFQTDYPPALLLRGRMQLSAGELENAIGSLSRAAQAAPLPEYQWALAEALRAAHRTEDAQAVESRIISLGPRTDPRTCSLFLATHRERVDLAERLAREQLGERMDVFTHDALAWALAASGRLGEALSHMRLAVAEGTRDARLFLHATVITAQAGHETEARDWLTKTLPLQRLLLPSERARLQAVQKHQVLATALTPPGRLFTTAGH